jgi:site-specific DNA-methyltransferase (adenine-specific)
MQPYYERDGITIYNADCMDVLPQLSADITFTSPPYNQIPANPASGKYKNRPLKLNKGYVGYSDSMPEHEYKSWMRSVFWLCLKISSGLVWVNHKTRYRDKCGIHPLRLLDLPFYTEVVWDRGDSVAINARKFAPSHEFLYGFGVPHFWDSTKNKLLSVWRIRPERNVPGHPCPFPVALASRCIVASCPVGGVVLDPFMGSGTTLVAAQLEGRKATGMEINERYCEIAAKRLEQKVLF